MAKVSLKKDSTSQILNIFIQDSTSTTGAGKTGLAYNTASLTAYYVRPGAASASISLVTQTTTGAYSSGGFVEVDATNMPGWYRFDIPNAAIATGANSVAVMLKGASGMAPLPLEIELTAFDNQDSVRGGMTSLPNAAAGANGGLPLSVDAAGRVDVLKVNGTSQTARDIGNALPTAAAGANGGLPTVDASNAVKVQSGSGANQIDLTSGQVKVQAGTSSGQLDVTSGRIKADTVYWNASAVATPDTAGYPKVTHKSGTGAGEINLSSGNLAGSVASVTGSVGSVTGAVGSVTGAVGSVTGNVGGNVVGSVASVTGAVGSVTGAVGSVTGNVGGNVVGSVASVTGNVSGNVVGSVGSVTGAVTVGTINTGVITATSIAADAIGASELAADAVTEIAGAVWDVARSSHQANGTTGEFINQFNTYAVNTITSSYIEILGNPLPISVGDYITCVAGTGIGTSFIVNDISTLASPNRTRIFPATGVASNYDTSSRFFFKQEQNRTDQLRYSGISSISYTTSGNKVTISSIAGSYADNVFVGGYIEERNYAGSTSLIQFFNVVSYDGTNGIFTLDRDCTSMSGSLKVYFGTNQGPLNVPLSQLSAIPSATAKFVDALTWLFTLGRNKRTQNATTETVYKDDGTTPIGTSTKSDDSTTFTRGKYS